MDKAPLRERARTVLMKHVIPALKTIGMDSQAARELVLGTGIKESGLMNRRQIGGGPACGLWQMQPDTFECHWSDYVEQDARLKAALRSLTHHGGDPTSADLIVSDRFAAALCRVHYARVSEPLPEAGDLEGQAEYWKRHYNTCAGHGKTSEYIRLWNDYVTDHTFKNCNGG